MQPELRPWADDVFVWLQTMEKEKRKVEWPFDPAEYNDTVFLK